MSRSARAPAQSRRPARDWARARTSSVWRGSAGRDELHRHVAEPTEHRPVLLVRGAFDGAEHEARAALGQVVGDALDVTELADQGRGPAVVVRELVDQALDAVGVGGGLREQLGEVRVPARPLRLGEHPVRDLADELAAEGELTAVELHEVASAQHLECRVRTLRIGRERDHELDGSRRSHHRAVLERRAHRGVEGVEAGGDEAAERHREVGATAAVAGLGDDRGELLDEERVAAAAVDEERDQLGRRVAEQRGGHRGAGFEVERLEVDRGGVVAARPGRPPLRELGPGRGREDERPVVQPGEEPVDEVEHGVVGPVEVGERHHEQRPLAQRAEELDQAADRVLPGAGGIDTRRRARSCP